MSLTTQSEINDFLISKQDFFESKGFERFNYPEGVSYMFRFGDMGWVTVESYASLRGHVRLASSFVESDTRWQCDPMNPRYIRIFTPATDWKQIKRDIKWLIARTVYPPFFTDEILLQRKNYVNEDDKQFINNLLRKTK